MSRTVTLMKIAWGLWGTLGCYRGNQYYKTELKRDLERNKKTQYYYSKNLGCCLLGGCVYVLPITIPVNIIYELYNLEEFVRGIKRDD